MYLYIKANRWKKKGLSVVPLKFGIKWSQNAFDCLLSVYAGDGSVMVTTGGIEMGQGLVTKVIDVFLYKLEYSSISVGLGCSSGCINSLY
jgi:xanthine dehydrogenase/oxidase